MHNNIGTNILKYINLLNLEVKENIDYLQIIGEKGRLINKWSRASSWTPSVQLLNCIFMDELTARR
jgi:hypothetical protein